MNKEKLFSMAVEYQKRAYVPYSNFRVGAAVYSEDGRYFGGCNIESASYGATHCAERVAIHKAVSEGVTKITAIAVIGAEDYTFPCGICRQVMAEFAADADVYVLNGKGEYQSFTVKELFPHGFSKEDLIEEV